MTGRREIYSDAESLARHAADLVASHLSAGTGPVGIALSGGSTPKRLFQILAEPMFSERIPWGRVHWFWGDERFVPPDHPDSNYRMARLALLDHVPVPAENIHPVPTVDTTPEAAADAYQATLQTFYGATELNPARPLFAVNLLGLGDDGHTASLFPGVAALGETLRWSAAVIGAKPEPRITLTYKVLGSASLVAFLVAGAAKCQVLERLAQGEDLPAGRVTSSGDLVWLLDAAAAGEAA
jgi:6-phosphogluconolactonase